MCYKLNKSEQKGDPAPLSEFLIFLAFLAGASDSAYLAHPKHLDTK